jgi:acetyltransferase-like isoleucine patch superfamily enzyme
VCHKRIEIGENCQIAYDTVIMDTDEHPISGGNGPQAVLIGNNVWIGTRAIVLKGVTIGDGAVIGAGAIVTRDVPARTVAVGQPARVIRELD